MTRRKFWRGTLREERCGITVTSTKLLNQMKKLVGIFYPKSQYVGMQQTKSRSVYQLEGNNNDDDDDDDDDGDELSPCYIFLSIKVSHYGRRSSGSIIAHV